jgi:hypothetical protein
MIQLHCRDGDLALKLGCEPARSEKHLTQLREDEGAIVVYFASCTWPLFWRSQLGRDDRQEALR